MPSQAITPFHFFQILWILSQDNFLESCQQEKGIFYGQDDDKGAGGGRGSQKPRQHVSVASRKVFALPESFSLPECFCAVDIYGSSKGLHSANHNCPRQNRDFQAVCLLTVLMQCY